MNAIEVHNLYKQLGTFALKNVSFTVEQGTVMGLIGQNGAGKSTTIQCLLNLLKTTRGDIRLLGKNLRTEELAIKQQVGVVFDELHVPTHLTVQQIAGLYAGVYENWDPALFSDLLDRFDLSKYDKIKTFSRGMKMRLALCLALSYRPKLLLLDEPTGGLDPVIRDEVLDLLLDYMDDGTNSILFSSHITSDLEKIADTFTYIHEGDIVFSKSKDALRFDYGIWSGTLEQARDLPEQAIIGQRRGAFGVELLVEKALVSPVFTLREPTIEEVMVFYAKGLT